MEKKIHSTHIQAKPDKTKLDKERQNTEKKEVKTEMKTPMEEKIQVVEKKPEELETEIIYEDELETEEKPVQKSSKRGLVTFVVLLLLIALIVFNWSSLFPQTADGKVAAIVNGQNIYQAQIDAQYDALPDFYKTTITKETILNQTIDEILLKQEIKKQGVTVTTEETNAGLQQLLTANQMSNEQFEEYLKTNNVTRETILSKVEESLLFSKFINQTLLKDIKVSDLEMKTFYDENKDLFVSLEQRNVSHILICYTGATRCEKNRTKEEATTLVNDILKRTKTEDFAKLAVKYSDDPSAVTQGGNLGLMDENTQFVEEFKTAAMELKKGEISGVVETAFGFHIIKVNQIIPSKTSEFADVKLGIQKTLMTDKTTKAIQDYLAVLRSKAELTILIGGQCDIKGAVFYTADWCAPCNQTAKIVDSLIAEGKQITKVTASDNDLVKTCFKKEMKEDIPQFVCKGHSQTGNLNKDEIAAFVAKCS